MMDFFQGIYQPLLQKAIQIKYWLVGGTVALFVVSLIVFSRMGGEFIPTLAEGDFVFIVFYHKVVRWAKVLKLLCRLQE